MSWDAAEIRAFPRARLGFQILYSPSAGITPIKVLKNILFSQKCFVLGGVGGWTDPPVQPPLSLSLLGSLVFPLPGGRGAGEERGRRRHHVHPQLRGPGTAHHQERQPEPAPAPVAELAWRWVSPGTVGTAGGQRSILRAIPIPWFSWELVGAEGCTRGRAGSCTVGPSPAERPGAEVCASAQPQPCRLGD